MMTEENRYSQTYVDMSGVSIYNVDSVDMTVTKVKLGYMRQRDNLSNKKGFLIPVDKWERHCFLQYGSGRFSNTDP